MERVEEIKKEINNLPLDDIRDILSFCESLVDCLEIEEENNNSEV